MKYRYLDRERDWEFFTPDCVLSADARELIRPLAEESAVILWNTHICSEAAARHPMLLPDHAWPAKLWTSATRVEWQGDWNDPSRTDFIEWLASNLPWESQTQVLFTYSRTTSVQTTWRLFREYWRQFLFEDEGPILWSLTDASAMAFSPQGFAVLGGRSSVEVV